MKPLPKTSSQKVRQRTEKPHLRRFEPLEQRVYFAIDMAFYDCLDHDIAEQLEDDDLREAYLFSEEAGASQMSNPRDAELHERTPEGEAHWETDYHDHDEVFEHARESDWGNSSEEVIWGGLLGTIASIIDPISWGVGYIELIFVNSVDQRAPEHGGDIGEEFAYGSDDLFHDQLRDVTKGAEEEPSATPQDAPAAMRSDMLASATMRSSQNHDTAAKFEEPVSFSVTTETAGSETSDDFTTMTNATPTFTNELVILSELDSRESWTLESAAPAENIHHTQVSRDWDACPTTMETTFNAARQMSLASHSERIGDLEFGDQESRGLQTKSDPAFSWSKLTDSAENSAAALRETVLVSAPWAPANTSVLLAVRLGEPMAQAVSDWWVAIEDSPTTEDAADAEGWASRLLVWAAGSQELRWTFAAGGITVAAFSVAAVKREKRQKPLGEVEQWDDETRMA